MVGYNFQAAVDAEHHLIRAHEVTTVGHDRSLLAEMAWEALGVEPYGPKPLTSNAKAEGRFGKQTSSSSPRRTSTVVRPASG